MDMIIISENPMTFYDVDDYINQVGGGVLISFSSPIWASEPFGNGSYWTGTRISCSRQAVITFDNGNRYTQKWDKTFRAKVALLK